MKTSTNRKLVYLLVFSWATTAAIWALAIFSSIYLWAKPSDNGRNLAIVYPLTINASAVKVLVTLLLNGISSVLFAASYVFQVASIGAKESSVFETDGLDKTICVNNVHAPKTPGITPGMRRAWYTLVLTSLLLHGVFNDVIGISDRFCARQKSRLEWNGKHSTYYDTDDLVRCRSDISLRVLPLIIAGGLMLIKVIAMQFTYRKHQKLALNEPLVENLQDIVEAASRHYGLRHHERESVLRASDGLMFRPRAKKSSIFAVEKALGWLIGIIEGCCSAAILGLGSWMLAVWNIDAPVDKAKTSVVLSNFEVNGFSDSNPIAAYFATAATAAAPHVMLALLTLLNLSTLETYYLNKAWVALERGALLSHLKRHFAIWKPRTLPKGGFRGGVGILVLVFLPTIGHFIFGLALVPQEVFCETVMYESSWCNMYEAKRQQGLSGFEIGQSLGTDPTPAWTSYKLVINQILFLLGGCVFLAITMVAIGIGLTRPVQRLSYFYGRVVTIIGDIGDME